LPLFHQTVKESGFAYVGSAYYCYDVGHLSNLLNFQFAKVPISCQYSIIYILAN